jgi:2'-5' RNA ligase
MGSTGRSRPARIEGGCRSIMGDMEAARLFVALWPDAAARAAIRRDVDATHAAHPELRWQPEERWHLTLAFLGPADPGSVARRLDTLARRGLPVAEPVRTVGAGTFGPVLWLGVEHGHWLRTLVDHVHDVLHPADRRFRAHVTVARARGSGAERVVRDAAPSLAQHLGPHWLPDAVTLVESRTGPTPSYHVLHHWPLSGGVA